MTTTNYKLPPRNQTYPEVFIIESLSSADENAKRFEGQQLCDVLRLAGQNPKYIYFQEVDELRHIIPLFLQSQYRYLHFSCHGTFDRFSLTSGDLLFSEFSLLFKDALFFRRLFISACSAGNQQLLDALAVNNKDMHSVTAPAVDITFSHAAVIWGALYTSLIEKRPDGKIKSKDITDTLDTLLRLFPYANRREKIRMKFFFASRDTVNNSFRFEVRQ